MTATSKRRTPLVERGELWVVHTDGTEHHYRPGPADWYRTERITGQAISDALTTFRGVAAAAWSCAIREGHAYRPRKAGTDQAQQVEEWLETVESVDVMAPDDEGVGAPADPTIPTTPSE